jgi:hypothetical protein
MKIIVLAVALGLLLLAVACSDQGEEAISGIGTITYSALEGGCWGINFDHGEQYEFIDLPDSFKQDRLRVRVAAQLSQGQVSFCNLGPRIDIVEIHRL